MGMEFFESRLSRPRLLYARDADRSPEAQLFGSPEFGWRRNGWRAEDLPGVHMTSVSEDYARERWPRAFETEASDL